MLQGQVRQCVCLRSIQIAQDTHHSQDVEAPEARLADAPAQAAAMEADFMASLHDTRRWQASLVHTCRQVRLSKSAGPSSYNCKADAVQLLVQHPCTKRAGGRSAGCTPAARCDYAFCFDLLTSQALAAKQVHAMNAPAYLHDTHRQASLV